jgi:hypothetical protein
MGRISVRFTFMAALTFLAHSSHSSSRPSSMAVDSNTRLQETRMSSFLCTGDGVLERQFQSRFLCINSSLLDLSFCQIFSPIFPFYKMLFMNRLEFSCFSDIFVGMIKTREEHGFLLNPPVEAWSMEQKTRVFC